MSTPWTIYHRRRFLELVIVTNMVQKFLYVNTFDHTNFAIFKLVRATANVLMNTSVYVNNTKIQNLIVFTFWLNLPFVDELLSLTY